ncbi:MAG: hypothetical protein DHS20C05_15170 [Hyphococcus sp.]|nr:MAG: hypothetical protein DHS20C05_15170 [Marinicaulis sp.]
MAKKSTSSPKGPDMARKIWLAGIGAYGRAFSEAQESLAKVGEDSSKMFEDLVAKGEDIEDTVEERGRELVSKVKTPRLAIDERIKQMRARLNIAEGSSSDDLGAIHERLDNIEEKLDMLLASMTKATSKKTTKKKTATKKKSS